MKMRCFVMAAAAVSAALALNSCNREQLSPKTGDAQQLTLTVTLPGEAGTRAVFEENKDATGKFLGLKTKWELGDEMSVGMSGSDASTTFKAVSVSEDGKTAVFSGEVLAEWGELSDGTPFWSCYPSTDMDWRQQDGTLANLSDYDYLWIYSDYSGGKLIPNEDKTEREIFLFRFPAGFAFCDESFSGNITLEISGAMIMSVSKILDQIPATGENTIQAGPVAVSEGELTSDVYVAAGCWENPSQVNIAVIPSDGSFVKKYQLNHEDGLAPGKLYTITSVEKLDLVAEAEFVDLGLSVKWAKWNLGATKETDYGDYFAWGETSGYKSGKTDFSWGTYKWMKEGQSDWKYITKYTFADNQTSGIWYDGNTFVGDNGDGEEHKDLASYDYVDDAARAALGGKSRMPTDEEWTELREECTWDWRTAEDGYANNGYLVTGPNGKTIFLPAAGDRVGTGLYYDGSDGYYWSSSLGGSNSDYARRVYFVSGGVTRDSDLRNFGFSVRPVCD